MRPLQHRSLVLVHQGRPGRRGPPGARRHGRVSLHSGERSAASRAGVPRVARAVPAPRDLAGEGGPAARVPDVERHQWCQPARLGAALDREDRVRCAAAVRAHRGRRQPSVSARRSPPDAQLAHGQAAHAEDRLPQRAGRPPAHRPTGRDTGHHARADRHLLRQGHRGIGQWTNTAGRQIERGHPCMADACARRALLADVARALASLSFSLVWGCSSRRT